MSVPASGLATVFDSAFHIPLPLGELPDHEFAAPVVASAKDEHRKSPAPTDLKDQIVAALQAVVDRYDWIQSATFTGSFLIGDGLTGISDIDFVVIADHLNNVRFNAIQHDCQQALNPIVNHAGYKLRINPTLGPLKFNDPNTAVLHLMLYSQAAHVEHVLKSPFTCLDWQRSTLYFKQSMAAVYPVFALQPHHFVSARRSVSEYLNDYRQGVISYRELACDANGYQELRRQQPMTVRCRHEFAFHIVRFLMQNLLKLVHRRNELVDGEELIREFVNVFPLDADDVRRLYLELAAKKRTFDFAWPLPDLDRRLEVFVGNFESQFRRVFVSEATRHVVFRHAPTALNIATEENRRFVGRVNPEISALDEAALESLCSAIPANAIGSAFVSPLLRCRQTYEQLRSRAPLPEAAVDDRLLEIDYGQCDGQTVSIARQTHPELFSAWQRGEDPTFPDGESTADVAERSLAFANDRWPAANSATVTCTHNVVLRTLIGHALQIPSPLWHRLQVPHLQPVTFIQTRKYGWFADFDEQIEQQVFADFAKPN